MDFVSYKRKNNVVMKYFLFGFFVVFTLSLSAQDGYTPFGEDNINKYYLGVSLRPGANGAIIHYGLIRIYPDGSHKVRLLSKDSFMRQALGQESSDANPELENLFDKNQIQNYGIVEDLWKLRYSSYPFKTDQTIKGWADNSVKPSAFQMKILKAYGFGTINDFVYGDKLFDLLKDMADPEWIKQYQGQQ